MEINVGCLLLCDVNASFETVIKMTFSTSSGKYLGLNHVLFST